jgi:hypothetical protein
MELQLAEGRFSQESSDGIFDLDSQQDSSRGNASDQEGAVYSGGRFKFSVVIPCTLDRLSNVVRVLDALSYSSIQPDKVVIVCDGFTPGNKLDGIPEIASFNHNLVCLPTDKHEPGKEQPRNVGVHYLQNATDSEYVWFLDSDCVPHYEAAQAYKDAWYLNPDLRRIFIGPYDYLPKNDTQPYEKIKNDPRWAAFDVAQNSDVHINDISIGLACFGGNLVWPIKDFITLGGFWNDLHMGRCEDGELGIRACAAQIPMSLVKEARAYHIWHEGNNEKTGMPSTTAQKLKANKRDVPMINERHPFVQDRGLVVADEDGKRFDQRCPDCGDLINTGIYWSHKAHCER